MYSITGVGWGSLGRKSFLVSDARWVKTDVLGEGGRVSPDLRWRKYGYGSFVAKLINWLAWRQKPQ